MKIALYYNDFFPIGGVEKQITERSKRLNELGNDVTVIFTSQNSNTDRLNEISQYADVVYYDNQKSNYYDIAIYDAIYNLKDVNANYKIQVLNGNLIDGNERYDTNIDFDLYVAVSNDCAEQFKKKTGKDAITIPNLIDSEEIIKLSKEQCDIEKGDITFVIASRIDPMKGFDKAEILIKALEKEKVNYKLYIMGSNGSFTDYENKLRKDWAKYSNVIFLGQQDNPYKYMRQADYVIQLSRYESQCLTVHESLIIGTPVICTCWKTAIEVVTPNNGILLKQDMSNLDIDKILKKDFKVNFKYPDYMTEWNKILVKPKKKENKFTILVPNYNNGRYLEKCLNSILSQTYKKYEIIFVDDMSEDDSLDIANKMLKNQKVIALNQKRYNGGTRNVGIVEAKSDYTICIDSDDWFKDENVFQRINDNLQHNEDILFLEYNMFKNGKEIVLSPTKPYSNKFEAIKNETCAIWTKVVKTSLLKQTLFDEGNLMEDKVHHMRLCYKMKKWKTLSGATHVWNRDNAKSVSTNRNYKWEDSAYRHIADYLDFYNEIEDSQIKQFILERIKLAKSSIDSKTYLQL